MVNRAAITQDPDTQGRKNYVEIHSGLDAKESLQW